MEVNVTLDNFNEEVLNSKIPVILDFWAAWCGPCRMLGPVLAEIAEENEGVIKVAKANVDEQPELAEKFKVVSIPSVFIIKDGKVTNSSVGFKPKQAILNLI